MNKVNELVNKIKDSELKKEKQKNSKNKDNKNN